jgi:hypothetical protein
MKPVNNLMTVFRTKNGTKAELLHEYLSYCEGIHPHIEQTGGEYYIKVHENQSALARMAVRNFKEEYGN